MLKKTLLATLVAGLIGVGAFGATTSGASAGGYGDGYHSGGGIQFGGSGWSLQLGLNNGYRDFHPQQVCKPVVKKVKWWDRWGHPHRSLAVVGQRCFIVGGHRPPRHDFDGPWDNGDGWDNGRQWDNGPGWDGRW